MTTNIDNYLLIPLYFYTIVQKGGENMKVQGYKRSFKMRVFAAFYEIQYHAKKRQEVLPVKKRAFWALVEGVGKFGVYQLS